MAAAPAAEFVDAVCQASLLGPEQREELQQELRARFPEPRDLARELLRRDWLTAYQANQFLQGKGAGLQLGPYLLLERLGEGGMGQVFKARHKNLGKVVALKVVRRDLVSNPTAIQRFQ